MKEAAKGIAGVSTKAVEDNRKDAIRKTFNYDLKSCFNKVEVILIEQGAYIYAKDFKKRMIAFYVSSADTTPVSVFFEGRDSSITEIQVSSPSTYGKEFMAKKIFSALEGSDAKK